MVIAYSALNNISFKLFSGAKRITRSQILELYKVEIGIELHTWLSFINEDRESIAISTYLNPMML